MVKENSRPTEQRFDVRINLGTIAGVISSATEGEDYATSLIDGTTVWPFFASQEYIQFGLRLFPDDISEGTEGFILTSSPSGDLRYFIPSPGGIPTRSTTIVIQDDDCKSH